MMILLAAVVAGFQYILVMLRGAWRLFEETGVFDPDFYYGSGSFLLFLHRTTPR